LIQSCRSAGEPIEGLDRTTNIGEPAAKPVFSTVTDLEAWTFIGGELVPA